jgi:diguanylate cyclase (GGDEF)-like protein
MVISRVLEAEGFEVSLAENGEQALELFRAQRFPVVLTDIVMGTMSGIDLLEQIKEIDEATTVVIMSSHVSMDTAVLALRHGAYDYLTKPFENTELISSVVRRARENRRLKEQHRRLVEHLKDATVELQGSNLRLRETVARDGLTGLFNHRSFWEALDREVASAIKTGDDLAVVIFDVDNFKEFNDRHGHLQGDECLRQVARIVGSASRRYDLAGRYGGEEFVLLLPVASLEIGARIAERVRTRIEDAVFVGTPPQTEVRVTVSAGVASFGADSPIASRIVEIADQRLYQAKRAGRNQVCSVSEPESKTGTEDGTRSSP